MTRLHRSRLAARIAFVGLVALWLVMLRPQSLGGPATYLVVRGDSMVPAYSNGDLVVIMAQTNYTVGDVVGYRIPQGELGAGHIVLHRITDTSGDRYVMRGDNNPAADPLRPRGTDIAGRVALTVPGGGAAISGLLKPVVIGGLCAAVVVMLAVARALPRRPQRTASTHAAS